VGGLIATTVALPVNTLAIMAVTQWLEQFPQLGELLGPDAAMMIGAPLSAPIVEESTKGIGIVLLFWLLRGEFDNVRDGFIYGALVGAGFNWFESALYVQQNFVEFGTAPYGFQIGTRYAWLGLAGHALFSGIFGAALGVSRATSKRGCAGSPRSSATCWPSWVMPGTTRCQLFFALAAAQAARLHRPRCSPRRRLAVECAGRRQRDQPDRVPAVRAAARVHPVIAAAGRTARDRRGTRGRGRAQRHGRRIRGDWARTVSFARVASTRATRRSRRP
jgi:hypothetical protein